MGLWPVAETVAPVMLSTLSKGGIGAALGVTASPAPASITTSANVARVQALVVSEPVVVKKIFWLPGTGTPLGDVDVGIYTESFNLIVSTGSVAIGAASTVQEVDIADLTLMPGRYYLAIATSSTGPLLQSATGTARFTDLAGAFNMAAAFPLPATLTPAITTSSRVPILGLASRALVA